MNKNCHLDDCTYLKDGIFNPDCPKCMEIWCDFLENNNLYVVSDKK